MVSLRLHGLWACQATLSTDFLGRNTGVGCHFLLQEIFPTQGWIPCLMCFLHWQVDSLPSSNNTRESSTYEHHQMVNTEIRLIIFFAAEDGEAVYNQQKQDQELTVAQIMKSFLQNSDLK